jgi:enoyl-CoA hydratase
MSELLFEVDDGVALITFNRPQARNAHNRAVMVGLADAMAQMAARSDIRVGVLTGAGGNFCAGMDLKAFLAGEDMRVPERPWANSASRWASR